MKKLLGVERGYVEEWLAKGSLELKKEVEMEDGTTRCYYGYSLDDEGFLEYIYDKHEKLISYRELEEVLDRIVDDITKKDMEKQIIKGATRKETEERIRRFMFLKPIGPEEIIENGVAQKYGMKNMGVYEPDIIVFYDKDGKVIDRKMV